MHWYVSISYTAAATAAKVVLAILTVMHIYAVDYNLLGKMLPVFFLLLRKLSVYQST